MYIYIYINTYIQKYVYTYTNTHFKALYSWRCQLFGCDGWAVGNVIIAVHPSPLVGDHSCRGGAVQVIGVPKVAYFMNGN